MKIDIVEIRKTWYIIGNIFVKMPEYSKIKKDRNIHPEERNGTIWEQ